MKFHSNVVYQVNVAPVKELGNSLKLEIIEILVVSQLPTLHSESSNMLQGGLTIFSREQGEIRDPIPPWVGVLLVYHFWIRFVELRVANDIASSQDSRVRSSLK